ncbi:MAG: MAPEG family protein [Pseudomonadota bacterium]
MTPELYWLAATAVLTSLLWVPYILNILAEMGVFPALLGRSGDDPGKAVWAQRAQRAHMNAVENLVVFAPLALGVHVAGAGSEMTALAAMAYFWLRLAVYIVHVAGIPIIRTLLFAGGVVCQLILGYALLSMPMAA